MVKGILEVLGLNICSASCNSMACANRAQLKNPKPKKKRDVPLVQGVGDNDANYPVDPVYYIEGVKKLVKSMLIAEGVVDLLDENLL